MLAHKATHEGKVAAEVIAGHNVAFNPMIIPSVCYTNLEMAWMGLTEKEAKAQYTVREGQVPLGRAAGLCPQGLRAG
jgi:dihydrolipoamide dehydrogenase